MYTKDFIRQLGNKGLPLPVNCHDLYLRIAYQKGLIQGDHAELVTFTPGANVRKHCGKYCSIKCMNMYGYSKECIDSYLFAALRSENANTVAHLISINEVLTNEVFNDLSVCLTVDDILFAVKRGLVLTDQTIEKLRKVYPILYAELEEQV